jgi:Tol biopolymer transport system component
MDDMTRFEDRFEERLREFGKSGVRSVDSAAVARAVAVGHPRRAGAASAVRWLGLTFDRRTLAIALAIGLLVTLLGGTLLVGARLLLPPSPLDSRADRLAYALDGDIYIADWDGMDPIRIIDGDPAGYGECANRIEGAGLVSPDGRHIAYRSDWGNDCPGPVAIIDLDGHLVASLPAGLGWVIAWSPDSTRVATWLPNSSQIGVYRLDGVRLAALDGSRMCCGDYDPMWSPDGASLLIPTIDRDVWEVPIDGSAPRPLRADDPRSHRAFAATSDGTRAAFIVFENREGMTADSLVVAAADGTDRRVLVEEGPGQSLDAGWGRGPLWSPAGDLIAYVIGLELSTDGDGNLTPRTSDLRLVDTRTGTSTTLRSVPGAAGITPLAFSADGDRILFAQTDADDVRSLWAVNTDSSGARMLVSGTDDGEWFSPPADAEVSSTP